jgi:hypothetical protein
LKVLTPGACHRHLAVQEWAHSSFSQRRKLLKIMLKFIIENQETICRSALQLWLYLTGVLVFTECISKHFPSLASGCCTTWPAEVAEGG